MTGAFIVFFALTAVAFAVLVLTVRQPMRAALALIAHMISLAAVYACVGAHVVAIFQVLIYVGAVMVFMVYTIMLLDDRDASYQHVFSRQATPALVVILVLAAGLWTLLGHMPETTPAAAAAGGGPFTFSAFSLEFMKRYWFHFELATVLLVIGIVAAWTAIKERW